MELTLIELNVICDALNKLQNAIASNMWNVENDNKMSSSDAYEVMQGLMKSHTEVTAVFVKIVHERDKINLTNHDRNTATDRYAFKLSGETSAHSVPCSIHNTGKSPI